MTSRTHRPSRLSSLALASFLSLAMGAAWAQGAGTGAGSMGSSGGSGSTATGGQSAPTVQPGTGTRNTPKSNLARADRKFLEEAASSGMMELQAAQLAATKATDPAVKSYASTLADHHGTANSELMQLAASLGVELPAAPQRSARNQLEKLGKRTGAEFDREFVREVGIKEHERDIKKFQNASKDVKEPQLKAWIDKTLPALQQHLAAAQKLPQAGSDAAASTKTQQQRMGAGQGNAPSMGTGSGSSGGSYGSSPGGSTR